MSRPRPSLANDTPTPLPLPLWSRRIRELRLERDWSQQELGERSDGVAVATVSAIERGGHTGTDTLEKFAKAFGVPLSLLFLEDADGRLTPAQERALVEKLLTAIRECVAKALHPAPAPPTPE